MTSQHPAMREVVGYRLWVGPAAVLDDPRAVCERGVEAAVCVAPELLPVRWPRDLTYLRIPLSDDGENSSDTLRRAVAIVGGLIRDNVPTLVVCSMGHSRSIAVAAAAIAGCEAASPDDVLRRISADQPADVSPGLWSSIRQIL